MSNHSAIHQSNFQHIPNNFHLSLYTVSIIWQRGCFHTGHGWQQPLASPWVVVEAWACYTSWYENSRVITSKYHECNINLKDASISKFIIKSSTSTVYAAFNALVTLAKRWEMCVDRKKSFSDSGLPSLIWRNAEKTGLLNRNRNWWSFV